MKRTPLRRTKGINRITKKTADRNQIWKGFCLYLMGQDVAKYGHIICWWCGEGGSLDKDSFNATWGHHADGDRDNCTIDNCYICHNRCNTEIHDNNIDVRVFKNRKEWKNGRRS